MAPSFAGESLETTKFVHQLFYWRVAKPKVDGPTQRETDQKSKKMTQETITPGNYQPSWFFHR